MDDNRLPRRLVESKPEGKRSAGTTKARYLNVATANLRTLGVTSWETLAAHRTRSRTTRDCNAGKVN